MYVGRLYLLRSRSHCTRRPFIHASRYVYRVGREGERGRGPPSRRIKKEREISAAPPPLVCRPSLPDQMLLLLFIFSFRSLSDPVPLRPPTTDCGPHHGAFCSCRFYGDEPGLSHQGLTWSAQGLTPHSGAIWGNREPRPRHRDLSLCVRVARSRVFGHNTAGARRVRSNVANE